MRKRLLSLLPGHAMRAARGATVSGDTAWFQTTPMSRLSGEAVEFRDSFAIESIAQLHDLLSNPIAGRKLREYLSHRCGSGSIDFLLSYWTFNKSRNALERYQQLSFLVHSLGKAPGARPEHLTEANRQRVVKEWEPWEEGGRVPIGASFPGLDAAAVEVEKDACLKSGLQFKRRGRKGVK